MPRSHQNKPYWTMYHIVMALAFVTLVPCLLLFALTVRISLALRQAQIQRRRLCTPSGDQPAINGSGGYIKGINSNSCGNIKGIINGSGNIKGIINGGGSIKGIINGSSSGGRESLTTCASATGSTAATSASAAVDKR